MSVETLWVLSLALKVLNRCFKSDKIADISKKIFSAGFIQSLVYLACTGTGLNQNWLLKDLEVGWFFSVWQQMQGGSRKTSLIMSLDAGGQPVFCGPHYIRFISFIYQLHADRLKVIYTARPGLKVWI